MTDDHETEVTRDVTSFVAELRRLADALETGSAYTIDLDGDLVTIPMNAMLSVAHEEDDGEVELEFQLSWSLADQNEDDTEAADADDADAEAADADEADTEAADAEDDAETADPEKQSKTA